jgi:superfamily I DNA/RNA helicase
VSYILIEKNACIEIVQNRFYQNTGFPPARELISLIKDGNSVLTGLGVSKNNRGAIVYLGSPSEDAIVFDLGTLSIVSDCVESDLLLVVQKTLRFCIKYWDSLALSSGEMFLKGSTKALVFPFPYVANRSGYRVTIEREPNAKRLSKRATGRYLLAYKSGKSEGEGAHEEASLTNFRKAYDDFSKLEDIIGTQLTDGQAKNSLSTYGITTLNGTTSTIPAEQGFKRWSHLLTDEQSKFVRSDWAVPHRLEGPAGTGKTLCLVLKAINTLRTMAEDHQPHRAIFVVPSDELAEIIKNRFVGNGGADYLVDSSTEYTEQLQTISVITLQKLCAQLLNHKIDETEFLDRDSVESKNTQLLYLDQIVSDVKNKDVSLLGQFLSREFIEFLTAEDSWTLAQLFRHEVAVVIKGRANGNLDVYKLIPPLDYGLPIRTQHDKEYVFRKYLEYQEKLESSNQYDIDDIVISAIGQLDTPIWRRRRQQLGYDSIFIDEVHLFNLNEISVLHYLTKQPSQVPISYSIDRSQAVGDIGWNDSEFYEALGANKNSIAPTNPVNAVFRSSSEIVELAFCVTTSGASLFTNFQNPLELATETFTADEEKKCAKPCVTYISDDEDFAFATTKQVDAMARSLQVSKDNILVVVFDDQLLGAIKHSWRHANKGFKALDKRGDLLAVNEASKAGCPIVSSPELVGGLEFMGVILVGCDKGRLPQNGSTSEFGRAYINYRAHNNLYVAITRAKYRVEFIVNKNRGISDILQRAIASNLLIECESPTGGI